VGDEALLLFEHGDTFVSKDKVAGLKHIDKYHGYDYVIIDDGLQNPTFVKSKKILVVDCESEFNNTLSLPAGPLRESFSSIARREGANLAILIGEDRHGASVLCDRYSVATTRGTIRPIIGNFNKKYIAVCGIAHPEKFKKTLAESGVDVVDFVAFGDHHNYRDGDLDKIRKTGYDIITTRKDWVKIRDLNIDKSRIHVLDIRIEFEDRAIVEKIVLSS
jgi:tetraacyldisaccharide 4'-kinase